MHTKDLIEKLVENPQLYWAEFAREYASLVEQCVYFSGIPACGREDALQDVYYELLRNHLARLRKWNPERGSFSVFLKVVISRILIDILRSGRYSGMMAMAMTQEKKERLPNGLQSSERSPREETAEEEALGLIEREISNLRRDGKLQQVDIVVFRHKIMGISAKNIAEMIGVTVNSVNIRYHRIKQRLQKHLGANRFLDDLKDG